MKYLLAAAVAVVLAGASVPASAQDSDSGLATVIDGNTLTVSGITYTFVGIVAPAIDQTCYRDNNTVSWPCGQEAAKTLRDLIGGRPVRCSMVGKDGAGGPLGVCYVGDTELNRAMVGAGMAVIRWQLGLDYTEVQAEAKAAHVGLWAGTFVDPWEWRAQHTKIGPAS